MKIVGFEYGDALLCCRLYEKVVIIFGIVIIALSVVIIASWVDPKVVPLLAVYLVLKELLLNLLLSRN